MNCILRHSSGTEGPHHDPYSYDEWEFLHNGVEITIHLGLAEWVRVSKNFPHPYYPDRTRNRSRIVAEFDNPIGKFEKLTGLRFNRLNRIYNRLHGPWNKCRKCGSKDQVWQSGYPGEEFLICQKCNHFNGFVFHESEII